MSVGIITVGNELLTGFIDDTNAAWLGRELTRIGLAPVWHLTIGDQVGAIQSALESIPDNTDDVIFTGGLGPTHDDITLRTISDYYNINLEFDELYWQELRARFERAGRVISEINRNQAVLPQGQTIIPNPIGSARGAIITKAQKRLFILPGVPPEMKAMYSASVVPLIKSALLPATVEVIRTTGIMESALAEKMGQIHNQYPTVTMAYLPRIIGVDIRLIGSDYGAVNKLKSHIQALVGKYIYGYGATDLEEVVGKILKDRGLTIATAESCTGGLIGHRLTEVPGSSDYLLGGIIAYSNAVKSEILGVKEETLIKYGAVSEETAIEMAEGVRKCLDSDIGISTTGIAGPGGGTVTKPVGLVYCGFVSEQGIRVRKFHFHFNRKMNKRLSSQVALNMIRLELENA